MLSYRRNALHILIHYNSFDIPEISSPFDFPSPDKGRRPLEPVDSRIIKKKGRAKDKRFALSNSNLLAIEDFNNCRQKGQRDRHSGNGTFHEFSRAIDRFYNT